MGRLDAGAIAAFAALGWRRAAADRAGSLARLALYGLILFIFWALWRATPIAELGRPDIDAPRLLWYMAITECITLAVGFPYRIVEQEILSGDIAAGLVRPLPHALATLAEWIGGSAYRLLLLAAGGTVMTAWMTGGIAIAPQAVPALLLASALATIIALLCHLQLGYMAAWVGSPAPLFWIWQKLTFVVGGLMLPLTFYPAAVRGWAVASPFAAMLYAPASLVLDPSAASTARAIGLQLAWLALIAAATVLIERAAAARFAERGV